MRRRGLLIIGCLALAAAGAGYLLRPRPVDVREIKRTALKHRQEGNLEAFLTVLEQVPTGSPDKPRAYLEQGRAYWELSRGIEMEKVLRQCIAIEINPESPTEETFGAWGTLGDQYVGQERWDEARDVTWKVFDARVRQGRPDAFYLILLLRLHFESAEPAVAIKRLREFLANDPTDYDSHRALGIYLARIGASDEAREHLELAVHAKPNLPRFLDSWLWYLFHVNDVDTAEKVIEQLPSPCDERPEFWVYRGKAADYRGDWNTAIAHCRTALELEPRRIDANNLLAQELRKAGNREEFDERVAYCQQLATAFRGLSGRYAVLRTQKGTNPDAPTCQRVSELCRELGWDREAEAWNLLYDTANR